LNIKDATSQFLNLCTEKHKLFVNRHNIHEFRGMGSTALILNARSRGVLWLLEPVQHTVDVAALRWSIPGGSSPVVFIVGEKDNYASVLRRAAEVALQTDNIVLLVIEHHLGDANVDPIPPLDIPMHEGPVQTRPELTQVEMHSRSVEDSKILDLYGIDKTPKEDGRAEWLVISYGSAVRPASEAVKQVRSEGQRVNHLVLNTLYPVREGVLMRAAMGISHIIVAEPNAGQYYLDVKRETPGIAVMPAGSPDGVVSVDHILERLQKSPRCC
jgi:pyruvate/2-oxoacid:ferredoxin oxidoreductase alpha subunit